MNIDVEDEMFANNLKHHSFSLPEKELEDEVLMELRSVLLSYSLHNLIKYK
jgi:hypothetical protein